MTMTENTSEEKIEQIVENLLGGDATALDDDSQLKVVEAIANSETVAENINETYQNSLSFGDRLADRVARFGGSWFFIILFLGVMLTWMFMNAVILRNGAFDPYPFILLNLMLSTVAAIQAPFILMSQNRQSEKDRLKADQNYEVSLKIDLELQLLHEKLNSLLMPESKSDSN